LPFFLGKLIKKLQEYSKGDEDKEVYLVTDNDDGCETCGWGSTTDEEDYFQVVDMDTKIWIK